MERQLSYLTEASLKELLEDLNRVYHKGLIQYGFSPEQAIRRVQDYQAQRDEILAMDYLVQRLRDIRAPVKLCVDYFAGFCIGSNLNVNEAGAISKSYPYIPLRRFLLPKDKEEGPSPTITRVINCLASKPAVDSNMSLDDGFTDAIEAKEERVRYFNVRNMREAMEQGSHDRYSVDRTPREMETILG